MHEELMDVWNSMWVSYKNFMKTGNMPEFTDSVHAMIERYNGNPMIQQFAENIAISWVPIINSLKAGEITK